MKIKINTNQLKSYDPTSIMNDTMELTLTTLQIEELKKELCKSVRKKKSDDYSEN